MSSSEINRTIVDAISTALIVNENSVKTGDLNDEKTEAGIPAKTDQSTSKRQRKKLIKLEKWTETKKLKRLKEREKYRQKRLAAIARGESPRTGPSRKELKRKRMDLSLRKYTIAVDLSFDELMIDKNIAKCVKQLLRVYTINRRAANPLNLHFTGLKNGTRLHKTLERNDGYKNWDIQMTSEPFSKVFSQDKIVYLTSDSDNVLTELQEDKIYIIGGLVDHNHNKGLCHQIAVDGGFSHARLPLNENVLMKTRTVLSIFHVFEILLKKTEGETWQDAILSVIPKRKGAKAKSGSNSMMDNNSEELMDDDSTMLMNDSSEGITNDKLVENIDDTEFEVA